MRWTLHPRCKRRRDERQPYPVRFRDEYQRSARTFFFGQVDYLRDTFKQIDQLVAPTAGAGYRLYATDVATWSVDAGVGAAWEKNTGMEGRSNGAVTSGESFEIELADGATLTQSVTALWKMNDFGDGLYTIGVGLVTSITSRARLSIQVLDIFKNRPPTTDTQKNDVAIVTTIAWTF